MIFVAKGANAFAIRPAGVDLYDRRGQIVAKGERRLSVQFTLGGAPDWIVREHAARWPLVGPQYELEPQVLAARRTGWLDTEAVQAEQGLTDEEREAVEAYLLTAPDVAHVEAPKEVAHVV